ncbi:MAG: hypothetical protein QG657_4328 [Acidobacteriota bacterium]|nr:hypothetical protein [Acidobacteriota bacterium]
MKSKKPTKKNDATEVKSKSFSTTTVDPYEAGIEIGEALREIQPEVILLFTSIHYDFSELFEAIYSILGTREVVIFGGTGDGIYETGRVSSHGIAGLGINGGGKIHWPLAVRTDAHQDPFRCAQECARELLSKSKESIAAAFVFADLTCDGVKVVEGVASVLKAPFIGGLTGDDWQFKKGFIFANGEVYQNAVGILGMSGEFSFAMNSASGWKPMGKTGIVEESHGNVIGYIGGKKAVDFIEEQFGMPPAEAALGVISLAVYETEQFEHFFLRTSREFNLESGEITCFGSINTGSPVRLCNATEDDVLAGVNEALAGTGELGFVPAFAVVISCGERKWLLRDRVSEETNRLFDTLGKKIPLVGFSSFGEIGPFRRKDGSFTTVFFHNVSYVVLLIGPTK